MLRPRPKFLYENLSPITHSLIYHHKKAKNMFLQILMSPRALEFFNDLIIGLCLLSSVIMFPFGSLVIVFPFGSLVIVFPFGSLVIVFPFGSLVIEISLASSLMDLI